MIVAINYANRQYKNAQILNKKTALKWGADKVICYTPEDIDAEFYDRNRKILDAPRGNGLFLWKPYFIDKALESIGKGDYLVYCDGAAIYVNKIQYLIDCMEKEAQDMMIFSLEQERLEKMYTKRDAFVLMDCDEEKYYDTPQICATYVVMKKTDFSQRFVKEWLNYAQDPRIISEQDNEMGLKDYDGFVEHRHDQSVLSLLTKKYGIKRFRDPSQYGMMNSYEEDVAKRSDYPQIFDSHRLPHLKYVWQVKLNNNKYYKMLKYKIYLWNRKHGD